jgi:thiosulfate dehydrogenase
MLDSQMFSPTYIGRENKVESLEERINGCFERSMNGRAIPENSKEMRAIVTYIKNISINTVNKGRLTGQGFVKMDIPNRAADLKHGQLVFEGKCTSCHGKDGQGMPQSTGKGYLYPPLWGKDSYNDGAGMARLLTATRFIKANMPLEQVMTHHSSTMMRPMTSPLTSILLIVPKKQTRNLITRI